MKTYTIKVCETVYKEVCVLAESIESINEYMSGEILLEVIHEEIVNINVQSFDIIDVEGDSE